MKTILKLFWAVFLFNHFNTIMAQNHFPVKIEERTEKYTETNSKYGSQTRTRTVLTIVYNDNTSEKATHKKLEDIFKSVPLAQKEYQRYKANNLYKITSLPLFVAGFWGGVNALNNKNKEQNTLIAAAGLLGGATVFEIFDYKKKRNINRMIAYCNNYWKSSKPQTDLKEQLSPDILKLGMINENTLGIGISWSISK